MAIDLESNSPRIIIILKALEAYVVANPDCTKEDVFNQISMALDGDIETTQEAMNLLAFNFRSINKNPNMTFEEMRTQVLAEAQLESIDISKLDLSKL